MGETIDITGKSTPEWRNDFVKSTSDGKRDDPDELYDPFFESEAETGKRLDAEESDCLAYIQNNVVSGPEGDRLFLHDTIGLYHWVISVKALSADKGKPIRLMLPMVLGDGVPHQVFFECEITRDSDAQMICDTFHRTEERSLLAYFESLES